MKNRRWPALVHVLTAFIMMNLCLPWTHADPGDDGATEHTAGSPTKIMLASPTLVLPRYDSTLTTRKVRCVWSSVAGATAYRVVMSMDSSFATVVRDTVLADTARYSGCRGSDGITGASAPNLPRIPGRGAWS